MRLPPGRGSHAGKKRSRRKDSSVKTPARRLPPGKAGPWLTVALDLGAYFENPSPRALRQSCPGTPSGCFLGVDEKRCRDLHVAVTVEEVQIQDVVDCPKIFRALQESKRQTLLASEIAKFVERVRKVEINGQEFKAVLSPVFVNGLEGCELCMTSGRLSFPEIKQQ